MSNANDIVVTARRREESLQDVPAAISVLTADALRDKRVLDVEDLGRNIAGLNSRDSLGGAYNLVFTIRGLGSTIGGNPSVLTYVNEVPSDNLNSSLNDIASVQVLKGPQGTLFGSTSNGGAVLFTTTRPNFDGVSGFVEGAYGKFDNRELRGAINLPVTDGMALRVFGGVQRRDGHIKVLNFPGLRLGGIRDEAAIVTLRIQPTADITSDTIYNYYHLKTAGPPPAILSYVDPNPNCVGFPFQNYGCAYGVATLQNYLAEQQARGPYKINVTPPPPGTSVRDAFLAQFLNQTITNITSVQLNDALTLRNIVGYFWTKNYRHYRASDEDSTPFKGYEAFQGNVRGGNNNRLSIEPQLQGRIGKAADFVVGTYYQRDKSPGGFSQTVYFPLFTLTTAPTLPSSITQKAVYAQATVHGDPFGLTGLSLTAGGRKTWTRDRQQIGRPDAQGGESVLKSSAFTYVLSLDYKLRDETLLYVAHRRGFKPGGQNAVATIPANGAAYRTYRPETVKDVEFGIKNGFSGGNVTGTVNVAVYQQWYDNMQRFSALNQSGGATINAQSAKIKGIELEASVTIDRRLTLSGYYTYTDAKFNRYLAPRFGNGAITTPVELVDLSASRFTGVSKNTGSATVAYDLPFVPEDRGKLTVSGTYYYQAKFYDNDDNIGIPNAVVPSYDLINARIEWSKIGGSGLDAALFVENLENNTYMVGGNSAVIPATGIGTKRYGQPRTYGIQLHYEF